MLTHIELEHFKPFGAPQTLPLAPITLIYGQNSGGKSSIIQSLLLMKQTLEMGFEGYSSLISRGKHIDLGSFTSMVFKHDIQQQIRLAYTFERQPGRLRPFGLSPRVYNKFSPMRFELSFGLPEHHVLNRHRSSAEIQTLRLQHAQADIPGSSPLSYTLSPADLHPDTAGELELYTQSGPVYTWHSDADLAAFARSVYAACLSAMAEQHKRLCDELQRSRDKGHHELAEARQAEAQRLLHLRTHLENQPTEGLNLIEDILHTTCFTSRGMLPHRLKAQQGASLFSTLGQQRVPAALRNAPLLAPLSEAEMLQVLNLIAAQLEAYSPKISELAQILERCFASISYLGPLRSPPERFYLLSELDTRSVGTRGEYMPQLLYRHGDKMLERVNRWFAAFQIPYTLQLSLETKNKVAGELLSLVLHDQRTGVEVAPSDVGFGIGQLLPILVEGGIAEHGIICVEQPEIHLHPRLQAEIADFLIESAGIHRHDKPTAQNQWIIETHSEALMLRLQKRIRQGVIAPRDVAVLYVEPGHEERGSRVIHLRLDDDGEFRDEWPQGFFEERFDEVFDAPC